MFSPGVKTPDNEQVAHQLASESLENSESLTKEESLAEIETLDLLERAKSESSSKILILCCLRLFFVFIIT